MGGSYDSMDGIGRVESGTETESNAGAITEEQLSSLAPLIRDYLIVVCPLLLLSPTPLISDPLPIIA